jgi:plasmid maintenance system antidote protein VapI
MTEHNHPPGIAYYTHCPACATDVCAVHGAPPAGHQSCPRCERSLLPPHRSEPFDPDWTIAPGVTLREWREENKLPASAAATCCGRMPLAMYEAIESGKRKITDQIAEALAHGTGIPASFWLNFERRYRADLKAGRKDTTHA